tara:strand:- start:133 stop:885 length:753 start_codon:yes stop_codon:yes gene_type:complete
MGQDKTKTIFLIPFNLQIKGHQPTYEGNPCFIEERLKIFKKYCLNAWKNQTNPNFSLLFFCDKNTPNPYKDELLKLENENKFIKINWDLQFQELHENFKECSIKSIKEIVTDTSKDIIYSRFYNDDIPEIRYVEYLNIVHQTHQSVGFSKGIYWDINSNKFLDSNFPTGPFISRKSSLEDYMNLFSVTHHDFINKMGSVVISTKESLWIQLIHGKNIWNRIERMPGRLYKPSLNYLKTNFALDGEFKINS